MTRNQPSRPSRGGAALPSSRSAAAKQLCATASSRSAAAWRTSAILWRRGPNASGSARAPCGNGSTTAVAHGCSPRSWARPVIRASRADRSTVLDVLNYFGPATGLPTLRACFPQLLRAELHDLLRRFRRVWQRRHYEAMRILHWQVPGAVWAIDFSETTAPIDGEFPYLLAVRDLASGYQLLWQPCRQATADEARHALAMLFALYGAPLVLKSDNGSAFTAELTRALLHQPGVVPLFSPPYWPRYNGAAEAGIGSLKSRTQYHAARHDRPAQWTCDDVAAAQAEANATARPHGPTGPTPEQSWAGRRIIRDADRTLFQESVTRHRDNLQAYPPISLEGPLTDQEERARDRQAIQRALVEHHYLLFSRRRIPLPFWKKKVTGIM